MNTLDPEIISALHNTWSAIGADCLMTMSEDGAGEDNEMSQMDVIEVVLDCNRLEMYGFHNPTPADLDLIAAFREIPYEKKVILLKQHVFTYSHYCM